MSSKIDKEVFATWLRKNTKLSHKVIGNTISRLTRIAKMTTLQTDIPSEDFLFKLSKKPEFSSLSGAVKSQLRNAFKLFYRFKTGK